MRNEIKGAVATMAGGLALLGGACNNEVQATQTPIGRATSTATVKPDAGTLKVGDLTINVPKEKQNMIIATFTDIANKTMTEARLSTPIVGETTRTAVPTRTATPKPDATKTAVSTATIVAPKVEATATKPAVVSTPTPKPDVRKPVVEGEPLEYDYVSFDRGQTITVTGPAIVVGDPKPIDSDDKTGQIMVIKPGETVKMEAKNGGAILNNYNIEQQNRIKDLKAREALDSGCTDGCEEVIVTDRDLKVIERIKK